MNPDEFLKLAEQLAALSSEAAHRSAVSRAYYGAFHLARSLVESCEVRVLQSAEGHSGASRCLQNCGLSALAAAGRELDSLRSIRNKADYDLSSKQFSNAKSIQAHLQSAHDFAKQIEAAKSDMALVRDNIRTYARAVKMSVFGAD